MFSVKNLIKPDCSCGKQHILHTQYIEISSGAIYKVSDIVSVCHLDNKNGYILCDQNTYRAAGQSVSQVLNTSNVIALPPQNLHADETAIAQAKEKLQDKPEYLVAVGAGTIHDIARYLSHELAIPFIAVPTAASVDGFVSTVAAMTLNGAKTTVAASAPVAVIADTDIISNAPVRLNASGAADMLGKYTALADWEIAHLLTNEYICEQIVSLEREALNSVVEVLPGIKEGKKNACEQLIRGLIISGLAMQLAENSRPASGAEHHISHLWEMHEINPSIDALHGEKVGVSECMVSGLYHRFAAIDNLRAHLRSYEGMDVQKIKEVYPHTYQSILKENEMDVLREVDPQRLVQCFEQIKAIITTIPTPEQLQKMLQTVGAPSSLEEIGLSETIKTKSMVYAPYIRKRLTLLRLIKLTDLLYLPKEN